MLREKTIALTGFIGATLLVWQVLGGIAGASGNGGGAAGGAAGGASGSPAAGNVPAATGGAQSNAASVPAGTPGANAAQASGGAVGNAAYPTGGAPGSTASTAARFAPTGPTGQAGAAPRMFPNSNPAAAGSTGIGTQQGAATGTMFNPNFLTTSPGGRLQIGVTPASTFNSNTSNGIPSGGFPSYPGTVNNAPATLNNNNAAGNQTGLGRLPVRTTYYASKGVVSPNGAVVYPNGVQFYGGQWWYQTPQNTWMYYNNGTWTNYNSNR